MVHPRVRTCSESKDSEHPKSPTKIHYNGKGVECLVSADQECPYALLPERPEVVVVICAEDEVESEVCEQEDDPWEAPDLCDDSPCWSDLSVLQKLKRVLVDWLLKACVLLLLLYLFVCSLDFLSSAFRLLGGKTAGQAFSANTLLKNPVCGLMIGILATVLVQSSSTSTSIIISMVASEFLQVREAIFIIMGANIGTSVTNTIVSMAQSGDRDQFRRAFAGATLHDMFNWLAVAVLLPLEVATGYLYHLTDWMTHSVGSAAHCEESKCKSDFLKKITKPFTNRVIQLDKKVIEGIALGKEEYLNRSMIKKYCGYEEVVVEVNSSVSALNSTNSTGKENITQLVGTESCGFLFQGVGDRLAGILLLCLSLFLLCLCLVAIVKLLNSVLKGKIAKLVKKVVNAEFPGKCSYFTGYAAMLLGAVLTVLVQSSSVFTSALTPLVGVGVVRLERMYPLTLGSNLGTTATGLVAALAAGGGGKLRYAVQIALVHLFFNVSGILLFYPVPRLRLPIHMAKFMGSTTARYRWFSGLYLLATFFLVPCIVFALTMAGSAVLTATLCTLLVLLLPIITLNILQRKCNSRLPAKLRTWDFLPKWMRSLEPVDRLITKLRELLTRACCMICACCKQRENTTISERDMCLNSAVHRDAQRETQNTTQRESLFSNSNQGSLFTEDVTDSTTQHAQSEEQI